MLTHTELAPDLAHIATLAFELENGRARGHLQTVQPREDVEQLLGHAVGEILLFRFAADVRERQNRDGWLFVHRHVAGAIGRLTLEVPDNGQRREGCCDDEDSDTRTRARGRPDTVGGHFEHPREHERDGKSEHDDEDEDAQRPRRRPECWKPDGCGLHDEPRHHQVGTAHLEDLAVLELGEYAHRSSRVTQAFFGSAGAVVRNTGVLRTKPLRSRR